MIISPYFHQLRSAYQAEVDDLSFDSEGGDMLVARLAEKREQIDFMRQMIETHPEMVAVMFHQGFQFTLPAAMDHLLGQEHDELPEWNSLADAVELMPWAQTLAESFLKEPAGDRFMVVAAALEYMHARFDPALNPEPDDERDDDDDHEHHDTDEGALAHDDHDDSDARSRAEAGANWLAEQGFDRKD